MFDSINKALTSILDKFGTKWKTTTGAIVVAGMLLAREFGHLDPATFDVWFHWAEGLFGLGLLHARLKTK